MKLCGSNKIDVVENISLRQKKEKKMHPFKEKLKKKVACDSYAYHVRDIASF